MENLIAKDREAHLEWTLNQCATCGQPGKWIYDDGANVPQGNWCDACCDQGMSAGRAEALLIELFTDARGRAPRNLQELYRWAGFNNGRSEGTTRQLLNKITSNRK